MTTTTVLLRVYACVCVLYHTLPRFPNGIKINFFHCGGRTSRGEQPHPSISSVSVSVSARLSCRLQCVKLRLRVPTLRTRLLNQICATVIGIMPSPSRNFSIDSEKCNIYIHKVSTLLWSQFVNHHLRGCVCIAVLFCKTCREQTRRREEAY